MSFDEINSITSNVDIGENMNITTNPIIGAWNTQLPLNDYNMSTCLWQNFSLPCEKCGSKNNVLTIGDALSYCKDCIKKIVEEKKKKVKCYVCLKEKSREETIFVDYDKNKNKLGICGLCIRDKLFSPGNIISQKLKKDFEQRSKK